MATHSSLRASLTLLACLAWLMGASAYAADPHPSPGTPKPGAAADPVTPPAPPRDLRQITNLTGVDAVRAYCNEAHVAISELGDGPFHILLIGGMQLSKSAEMLRLAKLTLEHLELWSGQQEMFLRKVQIPSEVLFLGVFRNDGDYNGLIDYMLAHQMMSLGGGDPTIIKKTAGFSAQRCMFAKGSSVEQVQENEAVYAASCMAMDAFYMARGDKRPPAWLREGVGSDLQRVLCQGNVRCTTVAYELHPEPPVQNWASDMAYMINKNDNRLLPATSLLRLHLETLAAVNYRQMWSLCSFVRQGCGAKKGPDNKFLQVLDSTATDADSETALKNILGIKDPTLTDAWHQWARTQK